MNIFSEDVYKLLVRIRPPGKLDIGVIKEIRRASRIVNNYPSSVIDTLIKIISNGISSPQTYNIIEHSDLVRKLHEGIESGAGISAWLGQGISHVNNEAVEPIDVVRDYLWLRNFSGSQSMLSKPTMTILVADELEKYDKVSPEVIMEATHNRVSLLEACNRIWYGNVKIDLASQILSQGNYQEIHGKVIRELDKQLSLREILRKTIPKRYADDPEAMKYPEHEVTLALYYAELENNQVKVGHPLEIGYDKVIRAISRRYCKQPVSAIHLYHVPLTTGPLEIKDKYGVFTIGHKSKVGISYRAKSLHVKNPKEERILITDTLEDVERKLIMTYEDWYYLDLAATVLNASDPSSIDINLLEQSKKLPRSERVNYIARMLYQHALEPLQTEMKLT